MFADDERRADLAARPSPPHVDLNGIDFVEVDPADHRILRVSFLKPIPAGAYGVAADPTRRHIAGGTRIVGIKAMAATIESASVLRIDVTAGGDFSPYVLSLPDAPGLDPVRRRTVFSFMASCPTGRRLPARAVPAGGARRAAPRLPRQGLRELPPAALDLLPTLNPDWVERNPSDLGIALARAARLHRRPPLLLPGRRRERGVPRHRCAPGSRPAGTRSSSTTGCTTAATPGPPSTSRSTGRARSRAGRRSSRRSGSRSPARSRRPTALIPAGAITVDRSSTSPASRGVVAFETAYTHDVPQANNEIRVHTWGEEECCLPAGTTEAWLYAVHDGGDRGRGPCSPPATT